MTAEIAVMNRSALALAADSASTTFQDGVAKIFDTADKLFELDGRNPVGVMVNNASTLMGVPWETVLKLFRRVQNSPQPTLSAYSGVLLNFLRSPDLFTNKHIEHQFKSSLRDAFVVVRQEVRDRLTKLNSDFPTKGEEVINAILHDVNQTQLGDGLSDATVDEMIQENLADLAACTSAFFQFPGLSVAVQDRIHRVVCRYLVSTLPQGSGLVIAGYGEDELFPSFISHTVRGVLRDRQIQITSEQVQQVGLENGSIIRPFAQDDMVHGFLRGVNPNLRNKLGPWFEGLLTKFSTHLVGVVPGLDPQQKNDLQNQANATIASLSVEFQKELEECSWREHINPVINAVAILPKDQLAVMAETLVALTSFKRRMSSNLETVGGAIDVAVISKGDGFVWIKRKHYFDMQLNPRYAERLRHQQAPTHHA